MLRKWLSGAHHQGLAAQWAASIGCAVISLGLSVILARLMGPGIFGEYAFLLGIGAVSGIALDAGFRTLVLRERTAPTAAQGTSPVHHLRGMLGHLLLMGSALTLLSPIAANGWSGPCAVLCFAAITLTQWYSAWLKGAGDFHREAHWQLACRLISAALIGMAALLFKPGPAPVFVAWALGLLAAAWFFGPSLRLRPALPGVSLYAGSLSFAAVDLATLIYHRSDVILLYALNGDAAEVGRYAVAYRLYDGVLLLAAPLTLWLFRRMRQAPDTPIEAVAMPIALGTAVFLVVLGALLGTPIAAVLFGANFIQGTLIGWLFCALLFALPNGVLSQWAIAHHQERYYAISASAAALSNVALNVWLIPQQGALGAAWATIATEAVLSGLLWLRWLWLRKHAAD